MALDANGEWIHVVLDKTGKAIAIGETVTVGGKTAVVKQFVIDHPAPPKEYMQHAKYSVLVQIDGGEERRVAAVDIN